MKPCGGVYCALTCGECNYENSCPHDMEEVSVSETQAFLCCLTCGEIARKVKE